MDIDTVAEAIRDAHNEVVFGETNDEAWRRLAQAAIDALKIDMETKDLPVFVEDVPQRLIDNFVFADGQEHFAKHAEFIPHTRLKSPWFGADCPDCQGEFGVHDRRHAEIIAALR